MFRLIRILFRLAIFAIGLTAGFLAALAVLPVPGKTYFNKMSKLPLSIRNLIDDTISLSINITKFLLSLFRESRQRAYDGAQILENKLDAYKHAIEESRIPDIEAVKPTSNELK